MIRQKRNIKKVIFIVSIFVFLIFLANLTPISDLNPNSNDNFISDTPINYESETPNSAILNLTEFITGKGTNQTVRLYMENSSTSINNQKGYFEIPSPANNMSLNSGDFYFNFNNNYTTDYIIEDDSALYPVSYYEKYKMSSITSYLNVNNGSIYPSNGFKQLLDKQRTYFNISSSYGLTNFTVCANFTGVVGIRGDGDSGKSESFDRKKILGFVLNFTYKVSKDANVTIYIKDICDTGIFKNITNTFEVSSDNTINKLNSAIINENLNYINASGCSLIRFVIDRTDKTNFNTTISVLNLTSFKGLELPITNKSLALDFDLRGFNSTVNGCYVWIRTLNITKALNMNAYLNISLYIANDTMTRDVDNLGIYNIKVKPYEILDSKIYDYRGDKLTYFKFNLSKTYNLSLFNYFIVIKSNISEVGIFSLATMQIFGDGGDGELKREHQIQIDDNGIWKPAISDTDPNLLLDASEFKLNITRGYIPSDFKINGIKTLKIQNKTLEDYIISSSNSPNLEWGLGRWNYTFNPALLNNLSKEFVVILTWNNTYIKGFKFNVNYTAEIYRKDNCTVYYKVNYDRLPEWKFNYSLSLSDKIFTYWDFTQFCFIYRNYFTAHNLTIPDGSEAFKSSMEESMMYELAGYKKVCVNSSIANDSGKYSLNLTSPNSIYNEHSYINFKGILWETSGFMYGDNISVSVEIQDPDGYAPKINKGIVNVSLYYPNGTALPGAKLISVDGIISNDGTKLIFDFNNQTILNITKSIKLRKDLPGDKPYSLRFFWTNGTLIGCTYVPIYIDAYDIELNNCTYWRDLGYNDLFGKTKYTVLKEENYHLLIASINETTGIYKPDFFTLNTSISQNEGIFTYTLDGTDLSVYMKNFLQNETILNPNETVRFKAIIENLNDFADVNVTISIKLVSLANENWILAQDTSYSQKLKERGNPNGDNVKELTLDLRIPDINKDAIWYGYNAPIRQCGAKAIVSVFIQNNKAGTYISSNYSLVVNVTDNIFEGYIIASKLSGTSGNIMQRFERYECVYLPNQTTFMVNIYDNNYVSSYNKFVEKFNLTFDSKFINITINPELIYKGQIFTISSILTTEFGVPIINESVYYQYYYVGNWINISNNPIKSNSNGSISFKINTLALNIENSLLIRLVWLGDKYILDCTKEIPIDLNFQTNSISIGSDDDESLVFRNKINYFKVNIENNGNSILQITNIIIKIDDKNADSDLINIDEYILSRFEPGEDFDVVVEIDIENNAGSELEIEVTIYAANILSGEPLMSQVIFEVKVLDKPLTDYVIEYSVFFILAILAIGIILVYLFVKRTNKKIELLIKEKVEERPKVSRYVKVSELKQEKIEEKAEEPKETKELEELITKEIPPEEKKEEKVIEPVKLEKIEKTELVVPPKEKVSEKIGGKEKKLTKKEKKLAKIKKKLTKKEKGKEEKPTKVKKKPLSTKELVELKKAKKRKGLFKKGGKKPKKLPKKVQVKKAKKKTTTDFDELLKEKGLND